MSNLLVLMGLAALASSSLRPWVPADRPRSGNGRAPVSQRPASETREV